MHELYVCDNAANRKACSGKEFWMVCFPFSHTQTPASPQQLKKRKFYKLWKSVRDAD